MTQQQAANLAKQRTSRTNRARVAGTARNLLARVPLSILLRLAARAPLLPLYHAAADKTSEHLRHLFPCRHLATFRRDLDCLLISFRPITLEELCQWALHGEPLPPNAFHLTCDDGLREAVDVIAPICREKGVPATFFLTTAFLDNRCLGERHLASVLFDRIGRLPKTVRASFQAEFQDCFPGQFPRSADWHDALFAKSAGRRPFLDAVAERIEFDQAAWLSQVRPYAERSEVSRLIADGFTIGAHTIDHPFFPSIGIDEQVRQTVESARQIEGDFRISCETFAFPFGADGVQPEFYEAVTKATAVKLFFGVGSASAKSGCRLLDRIPFDHPRDVSTETILGRAYAARFERRLRGIRS